jgi:hypothetical protein
VPAAYRGAAPQLRLVVGRYAATAARYAAQVNGIPVQSFFMKPSIRVK